MEGFTKKVKLFYKDEEDSLKRNYPGITERRVLQELDSFLLTNCRDVCFYSDDSSFTDHSANLVDFFDQLREGVPLAYISKRTHFYNSEFVVSTDVLIPRFETELLVEFAAKEIEKLPANIERVRVIDIGTGSGAIALSLLQESKRSISVIGTDISEKALRIASKNYFLLRFSIDSDFSFEIVKSDRLKSVKERAHLIVSNPPYIKSQADRALVHESVLKHEPGLALFIDDDSYDSWFRELLFQVYNGLFSGGIFLMEGHEHHLDGILELAVEIGFSGSVLKDLAGSKRFLRLVKGSL